MPPISEILNTVVVGDCLDVMRTWPDGCVDMCVTSPPYWGLRDYGVEGQIGLEPTPEEFVAKMVEVFREVRRVLADHGVCFVNLGDSYAAGGHGGHQTSDTFHGHNGKRNLSKARKAPPGLKPKDLVGIPWRVALALQEPYRVPCCVSSEIERSWLAALFDGEGTIGIRKFSSYRKEKRQIYQDSFVVYTSVTNSDVELLDHCIQITGIGKRAIKYGGNAGDTDKRGIITRRDSWGWRLDGNNAVDIIRAIYPYLIAKKKQAIIAYTLDILNKNGRARRGNGPVPKEEQEKRVLLWKLIKACNQRQDVDLPSWLVEPVQKIEQGWYLRSAMPWVKRSAMPESCTDRPANALEYVFMLTKKAKYFFDAEAVRQTGTGQSGAAADFARASKDHIIPGQRVSQHRTDRNHTTSNGTRAFRNTDLWFWSMEPPYGLCGVGDELVGMDVNPEGMKEAHFATFGPKFVRPLILCGTSAKGYCPQCGKPWVRVVEKTGGRDWREDKMKLKGIPGELAGVGSYKRGQSSTPLNDTKTTTTTGWRPTCTCGGEETRPGIVLDPFGGSGTTGVVAAQEKRDYILIELNSSYVTEIAQPRLNAAETGVPVNEFRSGQLALFSEPHDEDAHGTDDISP